MSKTIGVGRASRSTQLGDSGGSGRLRRRRAELSAPPTGRGGGTAAQAPRPDTARTTPPNPKSWDKDDGNYADFTTYDSATTKEYKDWFRKMTALSGTLGYADSHSIKSDNFTDTVKQAIWRWSQNPSVFNDPLRTRDKGFRKTESGKRERELSKAFKYELDRGIIVARGVDSHTVPNVGDITQSKTYLSTAYGGKAFDRPVRYIIRIPKGERVLHVSNRVDSSPIAYYSGYLGSFGPSENEILLRKNAVFRTTKVEQKGSKTIVYQDFLGYGSVKKLSRRKLKG